MPAKIFLYAVSILITSYLACVVVADNCALEFAIYLQSLSFFRLITLGRII